jgi:hypothetical protein
MSYYGWKAVRYDFEARWQAGHRAGRVLLHERTEILAGNYAPIVRELEPELEVGQELVLSQSRRLRTAVYDDFGKLTGEVVEIAPRPRFKITITRKVRRKDGSWSVRFDTHDLRDPNVYVRRNPPALREGEYAEASEEEVRQASFESAYTPHAGQSVDGVHAVPPEVLNVWAMQAKTRLAEHRRQERAETETAEDLRRLNNEIRELARRAAKMGLSPTDVLAPVAREVSAQHATLQDAA